MYKRQIEAMKRKYGADSNVVRVRVYGEFPQQEDDVFIPISWLEQSCKTEISERTARALGIYTDDKGRKYPQNPSLIDKIEIGCDVARFGDDKTCIGFRINEVVKIFKKYNVRYFFYNGGNDSMDTCAKISRYMESVGYECRVMGVPKTIDNDLYGTDHCPGFGSAAKYIATSCMEINKDARVYLSLIHI